MNGIRCPACGSTKVVVADERRSLPVPFGPTAEYLSTIHTCQLCGTAGDFTGEDDPRITEALEQSEAVSVAAMLRWLADQGISSVYLERALRLPMRTTSRWKDAGVSAEALALLRIVRACPWLVAAADADFEESALKRAVVQAAGEMLALLERENGDEAASAGARSESASK